jgi:hypothetical protein
MLISARLPEDLWPEAVKTASYLHNKNPSPLHSWKSPDEVIQIWMNAHYRWFDPKRLASAKQALKPDWNGIYAYGARAYPLKKEYKRNSRNSHFSINSRAHIGYLVGYVASNIYRVWVPALNEVITTRDVTFDEHRFFDPEEEKRIGLPISEYRPITEILSLPEPPLFSQDADNNEEDEIVEDCITVATDYPQEEDDRQNSGVENGHKGAFDNAASWPGRLLTPEQTPEPPPAPEVDHQQGVQQYVTEQDLQTAAQSIDHNTGSAQRGNQMPAEQQAVPEH